MRKTMRLTVRQKLLTALVLIALVGGSGGLFGLFHLYRLAAVYQSEQDEVAVHEEIHDFRMDLLNLFVVAQKVALGHHPEHKDDLRRVAERLATASNSCSQCHQDSTHHRALQDLLTHLDNRVDQLLQLNVVAQLEQSEILLSEIDTAANQVHTAAAQMEEHYHERLDARRDRGKTILQPATRDLLLLVGAGLLIAIILALVLARALARPVMPLIEAARRIGAGDLQTPIEVPRDPDLAEIAHALNDTTQQIAARAREKSRLQLLDRVISSQEEERKRVARELHDELGPSLSSMLMTIRDVGDNTNAAARLEEETRRLIDEVRRMAWNLRPALLDDHGLDSALRRYTEEAANRFGFDIDYESVGDEARLTDSVEIVLYRIAQEALTNVTRHARASRASVVLLKQPNEVVLLIEDDGVGFERESISGPGHLGLLGMEERAGLVGGSVTIHSQPSKGTTIRATVPLEAGHKP